MLHQGAWGIGDDGGIQAILLRTLNGAAKVHMIGFPFPQRGGGEGDVGVIIGEVVGEHRGSLGVGNHQQILGLLREFQHHEQLLRRAVDRVIHVARADDDAAVDRAAHVRVDAAVRAGRMGQVDRRAAVEDDGTVGVDAVTLAARDVLDG